MAGLAGWQGQAAPGRALRALCLFCAAVLGGEAVAASEAGPERPACADVALVLAIDASGSIDDGDFALQMQGYAAAFRDGAVHAALRSAGRVDVAVVVWGDSAARSEILPFRRLAGVEDATALAAALERFPRSAGWGNTGLARALDTALDLLAAPEVCAERRIVDLSGDGRQVYFRSRHMQATLPGVRARAEAMGVTINALAIETRDPGMAEYFRQHVMVGHDAFVMRAATMRDFAEAIAAKLRLELTAGTAGDLRMKRRM